MGTIRVMEIEVGIRRWSGANEERSTEVVYVTDVAVVEVGESGELFLSDENSDFVAVFSTWDRAVRVVEGDDEEPVSEPAPEPDPDVWAGFPVRKLSAA